MQTKKPRLEGLKRRNCSYSFRGFGAAAMLGRGLPAAAPGVDDRTLGRHKRDALGAVLTFLSHIRKIIMDECGSAKPVSCFHDALQAGVVSPG